MVLILVLIFANGPAWAQEASGKVLGTITDPRGGVIPGVKVTVTNTATQVSRDTTTDQDGFYQVISLPIGNYRVTAEHPGFRKGVTDEHKLLINQALRVDIQMELGSATETVEVTAQVAGVETVNSTLGQSVTSRPLVNLPPQRAKCSATRSAPAWCGRGESRFDRSGSLWNRRRAL